MKILEKIFIWEIIILHEQYLHIEETLRINLKFYSSLTFGPLITSH